MAKVELDALIDLAFHVEEGDPINWGLFSEGKEQAMSMIATSILEQFDKEMTDDHKLIMLSVITKLVAENMVLNAQLIRMQRDAM